MPNRRPRWLTLLLPLALGWAQLTLAACGPAPATSSRSAPAKRFAPPEAARLETVHGVPILTLVGSPRARGLQQGRLLREQIRTMIDMYARVMVPRLLGSWEKAAAAARRMEPHLTVNTRTEMRAMAETAGVTYEELLVLNTHIETLMVGCASLVTQGERASGQTYLGRNTDFPAPMFMRKMVLIAVNKPTRGKAWANVTYPGWLGIGTALNAAGIAVTINGGSTTDTRGDCTPIMLLVRQALSRAASVEELLALIERGRRCTGWLVMAADRTGGQLAELSARHAARRRPVRGLLTATNHNLTPALVRLAQRLEPDADTLLRYRALSGSLHVGTQSLVTLQRALHTAPVFTPITITSAVLEPASYDLWLWRSGLDHPGTFTKIGLRTRLLGPGR